MTRTAANPNPMPITLQPGASALVALMKADPEFAVDVKKGVVSEIVRNLMPKNLEDLYLRAIRAEVEKAKHDLLGKVAREGRTLEEVIREEVKAAVDVIRRSYQTKPLDHGDPGRAQIAMAVQDALVMAVRAQVDETLGTSADDEGDTPLQKAINRRVAEMEARIAGPMAQRVEDAVVKRFGAAEEAEVARRVDERLKAIRIALAAA